MTMTRNSNDWLQDRLVSRCDEQNSRSGKTSVGRILSGLLHRPFIDVDDDHLEPHWGCTVSSKLGALGDEGFIQAEGEALLQLRATNSVIALSGSNPLHSASMDHVASDGIVVYLDVAADAIVERMHAMKVQRIVGQSSRPLKEILDWRRVIYENSYDARVIVAAGESAESIAQRIFAMLSPAVSAPSTPTSRFISTRGYAGSSSGPDKLDFLSVVSRGLAPDGGLFVPSDLTGLGFSLGELRRLVGLPYEELALRVGERFPLGSRIHPREVRELLHAGYASFERRDVLPLVPLVSMAGVRNGVRKGVHEKMFLMETFHGPTASFKDLSLQLLPLLMQHATTKRVESESEPAQKEVLGLLVATSGDTGTAALDGFARQKGVPVIVLYPSNGVSIVQRAQMQTTPGDVFVLGVDSDFDFCQKLVKQIFNDEKLKQEFRSIVPNLTLSSANSMNWGRFLPQIVFSVSSYLQLVQRGTIKLGEPVNLVVPTGNFGNILGAVYARLVLGLPLKRIVSASNNNNVLFDFLQTGAYDLRQRAFTQTVSPSIDILVSSNLERFLHLMASTSTDADAVAHVRTMFEQLSLEGHFVVPPEIKARMQDVVQAGWATEEQCLATIKQTFEATGQFIDPHTAVAVHVANTLLADDPTPIIVSSTAHWAKFPNAMCRALGRDVPAADANNLPRMLEHLAALSPDTYRRSMHSHIAKLAELPKLHDEHCKADVHSVSDKIKTFLRAFAAKQT